MEALRRTTLIVLVVMLVPISLTGQNDQPFYVRQYRPPIPWSLYVGSVDLVVHYPSSGPETLLYGFDFLTLGLQEHLFGFGASITPFQMLDTFGEYDPPEKIPSSSWSYFPATVSWSPFTPVPFPKRRSFQPSVFVQYAPWRRIDGPIAGYRTEEPLIRYGIGVATGSFIDDAGPFASIGLRTAIGFPLSIQVAYSREEGIVVEGRAAISILYTDRTPGYDVVVDSIYHLSSAERNPARAPSYVETEEAQRGVRSLPVEMATISAASGSPRRSDEEDSAAAFNLSVYPVSIEQFIEVMGREPSGRANANAPLSSGVVNVSWIEAVTFCNSLSVLEGLTPAYTIEHDTIVWDESADGYRLPTEAEWERAALLSREAAETETRDDDTHVAHVADVDETDNSARGPTEFGGTAAADRWFWEWVWNEYRPARGDEEGRFFIGNDNLRVRRGGPSPTYRGYARATQRGPVVGFRIARSRMDTVLNP